MPPVLVIAGPTGVGKSELAMRIAERHGGEIVNADALQVYRGFDIGTAKPSREDQGRVRHHLIDILEPSEPYSAGEFERRARCAIAAIQARARLPIVVGGSGLYVRSLSQGLSPIPPSDPAVRGWLDGRLDAGGLEGLQRMLHLLDPTTHDRLSPADRQRISRALEVALSTGRPLSAWVASEEPAGPPLDLVLVGLTLSREILYDRLAGRVSRMLDSGWVREVEGLLREGWDSTVPAFQAIGYRQLARHVRGELSLEAAVSQTLAATRRFAKRQMTWFRKEEGLHWVPASPSEDSLARVEMTLSNHRSRRNHA